MSLKVFKSLLIRIIWTHKLAQCAVDMEATKPQTYRQPNRRQIGNQAADMKATKLHAEWKPNSGNIGNQTEDR